MSERYHKGEPASRDGLGTVETPPRDTIATNRPASAGPVATGTLMATENPARGGAPCAGTNAAGDHGSRDHLVVSPFYHSAVNAVTEPNRFVVASHYFIDRWMPILGGEGVRIVLALRRLGFYNPLTGEKRDEIAIEQHELADRVGISARTLIRELGADPKTGKPRNPALTYFVERNRHQFRDATGRIRRESNGYRIAMDDPIHPDDWPRVEQFVREREERVGVEQKRPGVELPSPRRSPRRPKCQSVTSVSEPKCQNGTSAGPPKCQNVTLERQFVTPKCQSVTYNKESLSLITLDDSTLIVGESLALPNQGRSEVARQAQSPTINERSDHRDSSWKPKVTRSAREEEVSRAVQLTGDNASRRRFSQLWGICDQRSASDAWDMAYNAVRAHLSKGRVRKPGAYFCSILVALLEERQIFVPTLAEVEESRDEIAAAKAWFAEQRRKDEEEMLAEAERTRDSERARDSEWGDD